MTMNNLTQKMRSTTLCLVTVAAIALPGTSQAGWFSNAKPVTKVTQKAKATAGNVQAKVADMSRKLNEIYSQFEGGRPLVDAMKEGQMVETVKEVMLFVNESQKDYQYFASSGIYAFEQDINDMVSDLAGIAQLTKLDGKLVAQLEKIQRLVGKMPKQFLYIMYKAMGEKISDLREQTQMLSGHLQFAQNLPSSRSLMSSPMSHQTSLCPLVNDKKTKVSYAVVMAILNRMVLDISLANDLSPDDLYASGTAVAGGGTTVGKFPTKFITLTTKRLIEGVKVNLESANSIAQAVCVP
jgi:hypothetical protein